MTPPPPVGFLLIDKEQGWTSHDVVAKVRGSVRGKVGHAGTLDPMATGLLVLALGRATRLLRYVQGARKEYLATALFGVATDSLDADGAVVSREAMDVDQGQIEAVLDRFRGEILQMPPMVSARKVEGKRLYELAREGKVVEREARPVTIDRLELVDVAPSDYPEVTFRTVCLDRHVYPDPRRRHRTSARRACAPRSAQAGCETALSMSMPPCPCVKQCRRLQMETSIAF